MEKKIIKSKKKEEDGKHYRERIETTRYNPNYKEGLTAAQVQEHRLHGWTNASVDAPSKTTRDIIRENTFTYFNLIFFVLSILLAVAGAFRDLTFP